MGPIAGPVCLSLHVTTGQEEEAIKLIRKMGSSVLRGFVVTNHKDEQTLRQMMTDQQYFHNQIHCLSPGAIGTRYESVGNQSEMKSILSLVMELKENNVCNTMLYNYLLDIGETINWDDEDEDV